MQKCLKLFLSYLNKLVIARIIHFYVVSYAINYFKAKIHFYIVFRIAYSGYSIYPEYSVFRIDFRNLKLNPIYTKLK